MKTCDCRKVASRACLINWLSHAALDLHLVAYLPWLCTSAARVCAGKNGPRHERQSKQPGCVLKTNSSFARSGRKTQFCAVGLYRRRENRTGNCLGKAAERCRSSVESTSLEMRKRNYAYACNRLCDAEMSRRKKNVSVVTFVFSTSRFV